MIKEYPTSSRKFKVNGKTYTLKMLTLGLQARIEDPDEVVVQLDIVKACTDMSFEVIDTLHLDQFRGIYDDIIELSYEGIDSTNGGESKKQ